MIQKEWQKVRDRHPIISLNRTSEEIQAHWDSRADSYPTSDHDGTKLLIFSDMNSMGLFGKDKDVIDIGCGPGTYDLMFSDYVREAVCVDGSQGMLNVLRRECRSRKKENITTVHSVWEEFTTDRKFDLVFSSMCPAIYDTESFDRMEAMCRGRCAYVSASRLKDDIDSTIWKYLGYSFSYGGIPYEYPYRYLKSKGRKPVLKKYFKRFPFEADPIELLKDRLEYFSRFTEMDEAAVDAITGIIESATSGGTVKESRESQITLMVWEPGE